MAKAAAQDLSISRAAQVLSGGGVVGYPSETVWGLAVLPASRVGLDTLYARKGREPGKPVQLSCLNLQLAQEWLRPGQEDLRRLSGFWPGPLTVLAWAAAGCPDYLAPGGVVGLRIPAHPLVQALLRAVGGTLATTSLNPSGHPPASTWRQAQDYALADLLLSESGDEVSSGELAVSGMASTVFDLRTRQVLRQGSVSQAELLAALA